MKKMTWGEITDFYKEKTGESLRGLPMDEIIEWVETCPELSTDGNGAVFMHYKISVGKKVIPENKTEWRSPEVTITLYDKGIIRDMIANGYEATD